MHIFPASWSQHLNRQIYHALAIANGYATEALGNVRTVKAFAAEKLETNKYDVAIATALQKGIIDAFGGAGERIVVIPPFISPHYKTCLLYVYSNQHRHVYDQLLSRPGRWGKFSRRVG